MRDRPFTSARTIQTSGAALAPFVPVANVLVDLTSRLQHIDGFGASDRDEAVALTPALADLFFSTTAGIGLSLLRSSFEPDGSYSSFIGNVGLAAARGASVFTGVWSAPGAYKDNGTTTNGGHLLLADYANWANVMAGVPSSIFASQGVHVIAVGVQNEPDFSAGYDSMIYTNAQMNSFVGGYLGPALAALSPRPKLLMPEPSNWSLTPGYISALDSTAIPYVNYVGSHQYAGVSTSGGLGLPIWQTEFSYFSAFDTTMTTAMQLAQDIHAGMTTGGCSAWCYWMLNGNGTDNEGLVGQNSDYTITKRLYVMGNWSKFVRPGFFMTNLTGSIANVLIESFLNPNTGAYVVICANTGAGLASFTIGVINGMAASVTPWLTDATHNLAAQSSLPVTGNVISVTLPATSVTSFVSN